MKHLIVKAQASSAIVYKSAISLIFLYVNI